MARAEPTTKVSCVGEWDAAKMSAHANDNEPLRVFDTLCILLWVTERCNINTVGQLDVIFCPTPGEDWLAPPLNSHCGAWLNAREVNLKQWWIQDLRLGYSRLLWKKFQCQSP
jgi:hypothetical protein